MHDNKNGANPSVWNRIRRSHISKLLVSLLGAGIVLFVVMFLLDDPKSAPNRTNQSGIRKEKLKMSASISNMAAYHEESVKAARHPEKFETATFALG